MELLFTYRDNISIEEFFLDFLLPNRPCLISNLTTDWNANEWCDGNVVKFDFLASAFGNLSVPVAHCEVKEFNANPRSDWVFKEYLKYWREISQSDMSIIANGTSAVSESENYPYLHSEDNAVRVESKNSKSGHYLKDWHFTRDVIDYCPYTTPALFTSDWLNEFCSQRVDLKDDYKFVYMGGKGTWTPLHYDVFRSYSWSSNIVGTKMWILFPSGDEKCLKNMRGELIYDVMSELKATPAGEYMRNLLRGALGDKERFREFSLTTGDINCFKGNYKLKIGSLDLIRVIVVLQKKGETIFVPSGWHHQVHNLDDVISINHNWINACNLYEMWTNLRDELERVRESISDCVEMEGWHSQCQLILSSLAGMDYTMFCKFILIITLPRLVKLRKLSHGNQEFETILKVCDEIIIYIQGFLMEQMEFKIGSMAQLGTFISTFVPSTDSLDSFLPSFIGVSVRCLDKHIIFLFFELSKILTVLREFIESKEFDLYLNNSKLCALMNSLTLDLSSIWISNKS